MNRLITSVICSLVGINTMLAVDPSRPRLVVGIMVDQLRTDYIEYLQNLFGEKGFRRLMKDGAFLKDVDFKVPGLDKVSGTAMIYTGAYPRMNGISAATVYDPTRQDMSPALNDPSIIGNFTSETYSPANLRLSTLSDEVAIDGAGLGWVYSIAPILSRASSWPATRETPPSGLTTTPEDGPHRLIIRIHRRVCLKETTASPFRHAWTRCNGSRSFLLLVIPDFLLIKDNLSSDIPSRKPTGMSSGCTPPLRWSIRR